MPMTQKPQSNKPNLEAQFHQIELELNAILEITQAINNNASEESLYMMYKFTLRGNLHIDKLALYVMDERWECKVNFGTNGLVPNIAFETPQLISITEATYTENISFQNQSFKEFDIVIPILHKDRVLAYAFFNKVLNAETIKEEIRFVQALSNIIIVAIENKKLVRKQLQQEAFKKEMEIAKQVQSLLFPKKLPYDEELKIKATYFPHDLIGGDYYDYIPLSDKKFIICIADVSGKGIPAALLMSNFQASLRTLVRQTDNLKQIVEDLNLSIYENARGEHFITFLIALYNEENHTLKYINAGHNPAFLYDFKANMALDLDNGTTILGVFSPLPFLEETTINNLRDFFLFMFTDGVVEVANPSGEQFGHERLTEFLKIRKLIDLSMIHGNLISRINNFKKDQQYVDDITLLSCRVEVDDE